MGTLGRNGLKNQIGRLKNSFFLFSNTGCLLLITKIELKVSVNWKKIDGAFTSAANEKLFCRFCTS